MTLDEVGSVLGVSRRSVERLVSRGELPVVKLGIGRCGPVRIPATALASFIEQRTGRRNADRAV